MVRGAGHFSARRWFRSDAPIFFEMEGSSNDVDIASSRDSVRIGSALVGRFDEGDHWSLRFSHEEANAIVRVDPGGPNPPMATGIVAGGQWTVTSPIANGRTHGWFNAGRRGGIFEGRAVALHRGGDGRPPAARKTVVILGSDVSIGFDWQGTDRLGWARIGDNDLSLETTNVAVRTDGSATIDFRPAVDLVVSVAPGKVGGTTETLDHLTGPERWLARMTLGPSNRHVYRGQTRFSFEGREHRAAAVTVIVD